MGLTRAEAERLGIGHLHPSAVGGKGRRGPAHERFVMNRTERQEASTVEFWVPGRPVGWKHHQGYGRYAKRHPAVETWQSAIRAVALVVMRGRPMLCGPVVFSADFFVIRRPGRPPDRTNLGKAAEDACQGVVFANDTQVAGGDVVRHFVPSGGVLSDIEGVRILVETSKNT